MEELLIKYMTKKFDYHNVEIVEYNIDGATCCVIFNIHGCREFVNINIWDMVLILNS